MTGRLFSNAWLWPCRAAVLATAGCALSLGAIAAGPVEAPCSSRATDAAPGQGFAKAAARVAPAVVTVMVMVPRRDPFDENAGVDFFRPLAGVPLRRADEGAGTMALERSFASGFIFDADGHILTSAHAVHEALETWVLTADGRRWPARVLGLDRRSDVALLKIAATHLPFVEISTARSVCPGDAVAALGSPFGFESSVTSGVVSAYPRLLAGGAAIGFIQTDVALNPGSSGGPLFDASGKVVGMNSMIYSAHGIYSGVSFTLPVDDVLRLAAELRSGGVLQRGHIGATTQPVTAELAQAFGLDGTHGALLVRVEPGGTAEQAGLQSGDIVLSVNQRAARSYEAIEAEIAAMRPDAVVALEVWRERARRRLMVRIARLATDVPRELTSRQPGSEVRLGLGLNAGKPASRAASGVYVETASGSGLLAGIEPGDRITAINGMPVVSLADFDGALDSLGGSDIVALLVTRADGPMYVAIRRDDR